MNAFALSVLVCLGLYALSGLLALAYHLVGPVLDRRQHGLLVVVAYLAGFCTAVAALLLRA